MPDHVLTRIHQLEQRINTLRMQEAALADPDRASPVGADAGAEAAALQTELDGLRDLRRRQDGARRR